MKIPDLLALSPHWLSWCFAGSYQPAQCDALSGGGQHPPVDIRADNTGIKPLQAVASRWPVNGKDITLDLPEEWILELFFKWFRWQQLLQAP